jgi:hypothetical protein
MKRFEQMLFALLRASLHERETETTPFKEATDTDWELCYQTATAQGVMALAWDGVVRLPKELQPKLILKVAWAMAVEHYEEQYMRYCNTLNEITSLYAKHGIATVQLKGIGFSTLYPNPSHREGGDIDIYTYSADKSKLTDEEAAKLSDRLIQEQGIEVDCHSYKHSNFYFQGIPFENHKLFLNVKHFKEAVLANEILFRELNPQQVKLAKGEVLVPSPAFNTLFIAFHALQHYNDGISLHHLCDWAMILKHYGLNMPGELHYKKFLEGVKGMTVLCNRHLGTSVEVSGGEKVAKDMLTEILNTPYASQPADKGRVGIVIYKVKRLLHKHRIQNSVFDVSLIKQMWKLVIKYIQHPTALFKQA